MTKSVLTGFGVLVVGAAAAVAAAGPLNKAWVAKDAQWVVHVDAEAVLGSSMGRFMLANRDQLRLGDLDKFKADTGVDPLADIKGLTIYGASADPEDGVAIIATTKAVDGLADRMAAKDENFKKLVDGAVTLYSWSEHGSQRFAQIRAGERPEDRVVLVAADKARLLAGAEVLDGKSAHMEAEASTLMARQPRAGSMVFAIASDLGSAEAMPFAKAKGLVLDMGEADAHAGPEMFVDLTVVPKDTEDVTNLMQVMQGAVAMVRMAAQSEPKLAELSKLAQGVTFEAEGQQINARLRYSSDKLLQSIIAMRNSEKPSAKTKTVGNNQPDAEGGRR